MYWQQETDLEQFTVPTNVVDLAFSIQCPALPVDHAWVLSKEICLRLPWISDEPLAGLHNIHVADSGNGWERPQGAEELLYPSRRTKLILRLPSSRVKDATQLCGSVLEIAGHQLQIGKAKSRPLSITPILYARYVVTRRVWDESEFTDWVVNELKRRELRFKKVLSGMSHELMTAEDPIHTRSLMVADMPYEDAVL
ncbi:MAG: hypothetical protein GY934_17485, partial [Gammaproteobacteria bacterium]|nr:hypothetical protein [Gammaproteobacteria bacterium]